MTIFLRLLDTKTINNVLAIIQQKLMHTGIMGSKAEFMQASEEKRKRQREQDAQLSDSDEEVAFVKEIVNITDDEEEKDTITIISDDEDSNPQPERAPSSGVATDSSHEGQKQDTDMDEEVQIVT